MKRNNKKLDRERIDSCIEQATTMYTQAVNAGDVEKVNKLSDILTKLYDMKLKAIEKKDSKAFGVIKDSLDIGLKAAGIFAPLMLYWACFNKGLQFEETGAYTATSFKNCLGKLGIKGL